MAADSDVVPQVRLLPVSRRTWTVVIVLGMVGQLAWTVENMYLNVFIYNTITTDPTVIAVTVAASAIAATLATMLVGPRPTERGPAVRSSPSGTCCGGSPRRASAS